jgi:flavodoxin
METTMKTIMAALAVSALLAGSVAPASAETDAEMIAEELAKVAGSETAKFVKERRYVPRQTEDDADKTSVGSSEWWRQVDRERGGRRR